MPKLYLRTHGCQMNAYDSGRMAEAMAADGWEGTESPDEADLILLNTCHIREHASEKLYSEVGRMRALKAAKPSLRIAVTGCTAQAEGREVLSRSPLVDLVVGPQAYHRLPELVRTMARSARVVDTEMPPEDKFDRLPRGRTHRGPTAFLTVQEGCDRFCTFCVVPYTRGAEASRPLARLVEEARDLVAQGAREITLLGQNVNAWHGQGADGSEGRLAGLIEALAAIEGLDRLRYTTSHPADMDEELIALHGSEPKLMPYLHLPVQSGSDRILAGMNRRHRAEDYLAVVARLRAARPDLMLSSDLIVGFPGETEADFEATLALVREARLGAAYCFAYSARPGTPAALREPVAPEVARARLLRLQAQVAEQARAALGAMVGTTVEVLFTGPGRHPGQVTGKSGQLVAVHVEGAAALVGQIRPVRVLAAEAGSLAGAVAG